KLHPHTLAIAIQPTSVAATAKRYAAKRPCMYVRACFRSIPQVHIFFRWSHTFLQYILLILDVCRVHLLHRCIPHQLCMIVVPATMCKEPVAPANGIQSRYCTHVLQ
ncbi:unnamed protein product, partial [Ectocarpus sp. 8 AP-2014]